MYICENSIVASKRHHQVYLERTVTTCFILKSYAYFVGKQLMKQQRRKKRTSSNVSTLELKDNIIKRAEERSDSLRGLVKDRVSYEQDLIAAETTKPVPSPMRKPRPDDQEKQAKKEIFNYIEIYIILQRIRKLFQNYNRVFN